MFDHCDLLFVNQLHKLSKKNVLQCALENRERVFVSLSSESKGILVDAENSHSLTSDQRVCDINDHIVK